MVVVVGVAGGWALFAPGPAPAAVSTPGASPAPAASPAAAKDPAPPAEVDPAPPAEVDPAPRARVSLTIESTPAGATVYRTDGAKLGKTPLVHKTDRADGIAELVLKLSGYRDARLSFPTDRDGHERVTLQPHTSAAHTHSTTTTPASGKKTIQNGVLDPFDN